MVTYAADNGFLVVSHAINTMRRVAYTRMRAGQKMSSLLMVKQSDPVGLVIASLVLIWSASEAEEWENVVSRLLRTPSLLFCPCFSAMERARIRRKQVRGGGRSSA